MENHEPAVKFDDERIQAIAKSVRNPNRAQVIELLRKVAAEALRSPLATKKDG